MRLCQDRLNTTLRDSTGYTIETHYARDRALAVLDSLCKRLEIDYEPVDV